MPSRSLALSLARTLTRAQLLTRAPHARSGATSTSASSWARGRRRTTCCRSSTGAFSTSVRSCSFDRSEPQRMSLTRARPCSRSHRRRRGGQEPDQRVHGARLHRRHRRRGAPGQEPQVGDDAGHAPVPLSPALRPDGHGDAEQARGVLVCAQLGRSWSCRHPQAVVRLLRPLSSALSLHRGESAHASLLRAGRTSSVARSSTPRPPTRPRTTSRSGASAPWLSSPRSCPTSGSAGAPPSRLSLSSPSLAATRAEPACACAQDQGRPQRSAPAPAQDRQHRPLPAHAAPAARLPPPPHARGRADHAHGRRPVPVRRSRRAGLALQEGQLLRAGVDQGASASPRHARSSHADARSTSSCSSSSSTSRSSRASATTSPSCTQVRALEPLLLVCVAD